MKPNQKKKKKKNLDNIEQLEKLLIKLKYAITPNKIQSALKELKLILLLKFYMKLNKKY